MAYGTVNVQGNKAGSAEKLAIARNIQTNLGSTSAAPFDGSANVMPGVTGTLPVTNGGTGATDAATARNNLGAAATSHSQAASTVTAGTLAGAVKANASATATVTNTQLRNISAYSTGDSIDATSGNITLVYE